MWSLKSWRVALVALWLLAYNTFAVDVPTWDYSLGMALDNFVSTGPGHDANGAMNLLMYSTILEYDSDTKDWLSDDQLFGLAFQAFNEMNTYHGNLATDCGSRFPLVPTGVSAIALGNKVYIASSLRGSQAGEFVYATSSDKYLSNRLNQCRAGLVSAAQTRNQLRPVGERHRTNGVCAEVLAVQQYYEHNNFQAPSDLPDDQKTGRVATWGAFSRDTPSDGGYAMRPCWDNGEKPTQELGCHDFMQFEGLNELSTTRYKMFVRGSVQRNPDWKSWPRPDDTRERPVKIHSGSITLVAGDTVQAEVPGS